MAKISLPLIFFTILSNMDIEKHLQFFANESNRFENDRPISERPYFFPNESNDENDDSSLIKLETDQGITYDKMLTDLIAAQSADSPGRLFALLRENSCIKKDVKKYVSRLTTEWRANKDKTEAVRLIDFHIVLNNIEAAQQILKEAAIDHDLLGVLDWAEKEKVEPSKANAIWGALCSSPISRAIARIYQCHLKDGDALQMQIAGHAEFINLQDAYVLASFWLGCKHPVTKSIYQKWTSNSTTRKIDESSSKQVPDMVDSKLINTAKDLIYSYRSHVCLLPMNQIFRFNDSKTLNLRQLYIDAIMVRNWAAADAIAADMVKRFTSSEYAQDALALLSALSQVAATVLDRSNNQENSQISQMVMKGGTMKDVIDSALLKNTIFARSFTEDDIDELDSVAGLVDAVLRSIRQAYKKSEHQAQHSIGEFVGLVLELTSCFAKLLLDFETVVESIKPTFTTNEILLSFFANDLGHQFKNKRQNERMQKLLNIPLHDGSKRSGSFEEAKKIENIIEEEVRLKNEEAFQSADLEDTSLSPVTPQGLSQIASEETVNEEKPSATAEVLPTAQMVEANIKDKVEPVPIQQKPAMPMHEENNSADDGWDTSAAKEDEWSAEPGFMSKAEAENSAPSFGSTDVGFPKPQLDEMNNQGFRSSSRPQVGFNQVRPNEGGNQLPRYGFRNGRSAGDSFSSVRTRRPWHGSHGGASGLRGEGGMFRN